MVFGMIGLGRNGVGSHGKSHVVGSVGLGTVGHLLLLFSQGRGVAYIASQKRPLFTRLLGALPCP